jgi:hypothetical protein
MLNKIASLLSKKESMPAEPINFDQALVILKQKYSYHIATEAMLDCVHEDDKHLFINTLALSSYNLAKQVGNAASELIKFPALQAQVVGVMVNTDKEIKMAIEPVGNLIAIENLEASYERVKRIETFKIDWFNHI